MEDKELREKFSKVLGAPRYGLSSTVEIFSWEEIFCEVGKLQERANRPIPPPMPFPTTPQSESKEAPYHFHEGGIKCYKNPCVWC